MRAEWYLDAEAEADRVGMIKPTWLAFVGLDVLMEDDVVGDGFRIANPEDDSMFLEFGNSVSFNDPVEPDSDCPYWTTTGDNPVCWDQSVQADLDRSAGGWSDVSAADRPWVSKWKWEPMDEWAQYRLYLSRCKEARTANLCVVFDWLRKQTSAANINKSWSRFKKKYDASAAECRSKNDWSGLWLTKDQKELLTKYMGTMLKRLP